MSCTRDRECGAQQIQNRLSNGNTNANEQDGDHDANQGILKDFVHGRFNAGRAESG
jgi:hypothetical protein